MDKQDTGNPVETETKPEPINKPEQQQPYKQGGDTQNKPVEPEKK